MGRWLEEMSKTWKQSGNVALLCFRQPCLQQREAEGKEASVEATAPVQGQEGSGRGDGEKGRVRGWLPGCPLDFTELRSTNRRECPLGRVPCPPLRWLGDGP